MRSPSVENYTFSPKLRSFSLILLVAGLLLFGIGAFLNMQYPARIWANLFATNYYFTLIGLAAMFFVASQTIGYNGWFILIKRIPEAMSGFVKFGAVIMIAILAFGAHSIYHWMHEGITDPASPHFDELIAKKAPFLNTTFFWGATIVYLVLWVFSTYMVRRNSLESDRVGFSIANYKSAKVWSMVFLVIFAVSSSTAQWHWMMSIDPHWLSTLYGWYCFASMFVGALAATTCIVLYLKEEGYLPMVNENHFQDLGKFMFAFSIFWTYLWFSQFMLIWYGNIPEETAYYKDRFNSYSFLFWFNWFLNFIVPFFALMTAANKRNVALLKFIAPLLLLSHWLDYYLMVIPGAVKNAGYVDANGAAITNFGFGLMEIGLPIAYIGFFILVAFSELQKASLIPVNHPFIKESMTHHVQ